MLPAARLAWQRVSSVLVLAGAAFGLLGWLGDRGDTVLLRLALLLAGLALMLAGAWQRQVMARTRREMGALRKRLTWMTGVAEHAGSPVVVVDSDLRVVWVNDAFQRETGYALDELLGTRPGNWLRSPHADAVTLERVRDALRHHADLDIELLLRYRDGRDRRVRLLLTAQREGPGTFSGYVSVLVDSDVPLRTREACRQALRDRDALMRTLDGDGTVAETDAQGCCTRVNRLTPECGQLPGTEDRTPGSLDRLWRAFDSGARLVVRQPPRELVEGKRSEVGFVAPVSQGTGATARWVKRVASCGEADTDAPGRSQGRIIGAVQDCTAQVLAQQRIREEQRILHSAMDAVGEAFALFDPDSRLVYCNDEYAAGMPADAAPRQGMRHEEWLRRVAEFGLFREAVGREAEWVQEVLRAPLKGEPDRIRQRADGRWIRFVDRVTADGYRVAFRCDVTALQSALIQADAAVLSQGQFLANMSHEIRTPINAIMGLLELLGDTRLDPRQADMVGKSRSAARSLLDIINDILDCSKIEAGMMRLHASPFRLADLRHALAVILDGARGNKPLAVVFDTDPALPPVLVGDPVRLKQVLINLGGNAIKFTERGSVTMHWGLVQRQGGRVRIRFAVTDTGIGIAPELQQTIFDRFSQGECSTTRRFGGSGLGLTISQRLVNVMGGRMELVSTPGQGSRFSFEVELPEGQETDLAADGEGNADAAGERPLDGIRLLLVEDNALHQEVAMSMLAREGAQVSLAENGQQAVEALRSGPSRFDAVLMDMQMPVLDGLRATEHIRAELGLADLPVIAMTASAMTSDRDRCLKAGMNAHLGKPFDLAEVVRTVRRFARDAERALPAPEPAAEDRSGVPAAVLDDAGALRRLGGNRALLGQLRSRFDAAASGLLRQAQTRVARGEWPAAADAVHQLKGSAGVVGADALAALCAEVERRFRPDSGERAISNGVGDLGRVGEALQEVLRRLPATPGPVARVADLQPLVEAEPVTVDEAVQLRALAALKPLKSLFEAADMDAIDGHDQWLCEQAGARGTRFERLNRCVDLLDLPGAAEECARLLKPLDAVDVVIE